MRFGPKTEGFLSRALHRVPNLNVRTRLSLAFLAVVLVSWALNVQVFQYVIEQDRQRFRREMAAQRAAAVEANEARPAMSEGRDGSPSPFGPNGPPDRHRPDGPGGAMGRTEGRPDGRPEGRPGGRPDERSRRAAWRSRVYPKVLPIQGGIAVLLSIAAGAWLARRFTRPLSLLEEGAHAFHERRFQHRVPRLGGEEFARVGASMNEMAERVEAQFADLETDARRRRQLLADVAHELRSPVATLKTLAEALRDGVADQPERRERALSVMVSTSDRLQRLVSDLMELAKLDLHELPLHVQEVDLAAVAEESQAAQADAGARAGIRLHPVCADGETMVSGDPMRLGQIVDNLLDNAIAHAGAGAEVRVEVFEKEARVALVVADTGRGIAAEHLPFIFDPFYRADTVRTPGANHNGLGLRIVRGLVEAHGGAVSLESEEGRGTRVTITLPALNPDDPGA